MTGPKAKVVEVPAGKAERLKRSAAGSAAIDLPFEQAAAGVLGELQRSIAELLEAAPGETGRAADVERAFGVDYKLAWQVYRIATAASPLAAGANVPARVSVERLLKSAARRKIPAAVVGRVLRAFEDYERLVDAHAGDRAGLDAMIGAYLPDEQEKQELVTKQAAYRAMSQIKGLDAEAELTANLLYPSADGVSVDRVSLQGHFGQRRLRPKVGIGFWTASMMRPDQVPLTLSGEPCDGPMSAWLPEFCSAPSLRFEVARADGVQFYWVEGEEVGLRSAVDLVMAEYRPGTMKRYRRDDGVRDTGVFDVMDCPTRRLTLDVFVHKDVYAGVTPELAIYDAAVFGLVRGSGDPVREHHRLRMIESIQPIVGGLAHAGLGHVARYIEMLEYVCAKRGWDPGAFRGYRLDVQYPVYGAQYVVKFELPQAPGG
ncbi:MAG: hypothetical protein ACREJO_03725 [Phycisphaerales bacterium]